MKNIWTFGTEATNPSEMPFLQADHPFRALYDECGRFVMGTNDKRLMGMLNYTKIHRQDTEGNY